MKLNQTILDELADTVVEGIKRLGTAKAEARTQVRTVLETAFQNLDIVTREQMQVQEALLAKTRNQIDLLENRIKTLEEKH